MFIPSVFAPITSGSFANYKVASTTSAVLLLSGSQTGRRGATIYNHSNASLFIAPWTNVSEANFMVKLSSGSYYELPSPVYSDAIYGKWDAAAGHAFIVDFLSNE